MNCLLCGKHYVRKSSLEKHNILCEFRIKSKREKRIDKEEEQDVPSYWQLVNIVQELTLRQEKMETQLRDLHKWTQKTKRKMNIMEWLNETIVPSTDFYGWINQLQILEHHFTCLMEKNSVEIFRQIIEDYLPKESSYINMPIQSFSQKNNVIYVYDKEKKWIEMTWDIFIKLLQNIQTLLLKALAAWKEQHKHELLEKDHLSILYNKMIIKLMNVQFSKNVHSSAATKIQSQLYIYLKRDLKSLIEYEFE